jgi:putative intracellular protease/amidase
MGDDIVIDILLFDGITALDAVGPYEVLSRLPDVRMRFVGASTGPKRTDNGCLALVADVALREADTGDVILVPGGIGTRTLMSDEPVLDWVRHRHASTTWTTSVCTGALVLGAAGVLRGLPATTHWASLASLADAGAVPTDQRVVEAGKVVTAAGVSAGIDMAFTLAARIADEDTARAIQRSIEYDPQPPFSYAR